MPNHVWLTGDQIGHAVKEGQLIIEPYRRELLKSMSYVLRLGARFRTWSASEHPIEVWKDEASEAALDEVIDTDRLTISKGDFVLGTSLEKIGISVQYGALLFTLSHLSRYGLTFHLNSHLVRPGFGFVTPTNIVLEISSLNPRPLTLAAGIPICHLCVVALSLPNKQVEPSPYDGRNALAHPLLSVEFSSFLPDD